MITLLNERGDYNRLCCFLEKKGKGLEHFLDWDRETWFRKLKAWMLEEGMPLNYERQGNYGNTYRMRPGVMRYVEQLLDFLEPEDDREEKEKDIWELEKLGVPFHGTSGRDQKGNLSEPAERGHCLYLQGTDCRATAVGIPAGEASGYPVLPPARPGAPGGIPDLFKNRGGGSKEAPQ